MRRTLLALSALLAGWSTPQPAQAQARKITALVVSPDRRLDAEAMAATQALLHLLQNDARYEAIDLSARARGPAAAQNADKAKALVADALNLIDEMKEKVALQNAAEALALYEKSDLSTAFPGVLDAVAARVYALHSSGDKAGTKAELARLFALKQDYKLDPRRVTPDLQAVADDARAKAAAAPRVALSVRASPTSAAVFVDGAYRGATPVDVSGLAPGHHYLTLSAPGYALAQSSQAAGLGVPVEIALSPAADEKGLIELVRAAKTATPAGAGGSGAALAKWAGADEALVVGLAKEAATLATLTRYAPDGRVLASLEKPLPKPEAIEELAREVLARSGADAPLAAAQPSGEVEQRSSGLSGRTWGFVTGGVAVAAVAGGVVMGVLASGKAEEARRTPLLDADVYRSNADAATGLAIGANVLYGVAAVAAGVATWLLITGGPGASPAADAAPAPAKEEVGVFLAPVQGGAVLSVSGGF